MANSIKEGLHPEVQIINIIHTHIVYIYTLVADNVLAVSRLPNKGENVISLTGCSVIHKHVSVSHVRAGREGRREGGAT